MGVLFNVHVCLAEVFLDRKERDTQRLNQAVLCRSCLLSLLDAWFRLVIHVFVYY